jgi:hypothetical protein
LLKHLHNLKNTKVSIFNFLKISQDPFTPSTFTSGNYFEDVTSPKDLSPNKEKSLSVSTSKTTSPISTSPQTTSPTTLVQTKETKKETKETEEKDEPGFGWKLFEFSTTYILPLTLSYFFVKKFMKLY